jgi:hypothetical protein
MSVSSVVMIPLSCSWMGNATGTLYEKEDAVKLMESVVRAASVCVVEILP